MGKIIKIPLMCICLFIIGICLSACGGGKTTPPTYPIIPVPTPTPVAPELQLSNTLFEINIGDTDNITVTLDGEDVTEEAIYTPDDENIATVEKGLITAHNQGTTIVNVHVEGAREDKTFIVNVIDPELPTLKLSQNEFDLKIGQTDNITVTLEDEDVTEDVNYKPANEAIATVDAGIITALSKGSTDVIVSLENANNAIFTVNVDLSTIELSQDTFALKIGNTSNINVKVNNEDITQSQDITYTPDDTAIATVEKGVITALSKGSTDVTVSFPGAKDATFTVNVDLTDLQLSKSEFELNIDEEAEIEVTCNGKIVTKDVTYTVNKTTDDENIVTVEEGIIKSQYQGGETTVTVSLEGISNDATFTVKVKDDSVDEVELNKDVYTALYNLELVDKDYNNRTSLTEINIPGTYKDNNGDKHKITSIGKKMFKDCTLLETVTIPSSITTIKESVFESCTALTEINIPDSVTELDKNAIKECTSLKTLTLGNGITEIKDRQFNDSKKLNALETINIGTGVKTIGKYAFASSPVTTINISESNKVLDTINEYAFEKCTNLKTINIPNNVADRTKEEGITGIKIEQYAFSECLSLNKLVIPDTVTKLGGYVCWKCTNLEELKLGNGITEITKEQFSNKSRNLDKLVTVTIGTGVKTIGEKAFANSKITEIIIPDNVETIKKEAFTACANLVTVNIGSGVKTIEQEAFCACGYYQGDSESSKTAHLELTIPDQVETIGSNAFSKLKCIYYTNNLQASGSPWGALKVNGETP